MFVGFMTKRRNFFFIGVIIEHTCAKTFQFKRFVFVSGEKLLLDIILIIKLLLDVFEFAIETRTLLTVTNKRIVSYNC